MYNYNLRFFVSRLLLLHGYDSINKNITSPEEDISKDETRYIGIFYLVVQLPTIYFTNEKFGEGSVIFSNTAYGRRDPL